MLLKNSTATILLLDNMLTEPDFGMHWIILKSQVT